MTVDALKAFDGGLRDSCRSDKNLKVFLSLSLSLSLSRFSLSFIHFIHSCLFMFFFFVFSVKKTIVKGHLFCLTIGQFGGKFNSEIKEKLRLRKVFFSVLKTPIKTSVRKKHKDKKKNNNKKIKELFLFRRPVGRMCLTKAC